MSGRLWTTRLIFALSGVGISAWALLVPDGKIRFHLADDALGHILFLAGIGGVSAALLAGYLVSRWGSRTCATVMLLIMCVLLPSMAAVPAVSAFTILLFLDSAVFGVLDVAINAQGTVVEAKSNRLQMSGFHASFSIGTLIMALLASLLLRIDASLELICWLCAAGILLGLTQSFRLLPKCYDPSGAGRSFIIPNWHTIILGLCCFSVFMSDGAITDWSTVFLHFSRQMTISNAVLGYATFMLTTVFSRLTGDKLVAKVGQAVVVRLGVLVALLGYALVVFVPFGGVGVIGFGLVGLGSGNITPLLFSAASRVPGVASHHAIPTVVGIGYIGFLAGPIMVGSVSGHFGLGVAFMINAALLGTAFFASGRVAKSASSVPV